MFKAYAEQMADKMIIARMNQLLPPTDEELAAEMDKENAEFEKRQQDSDEYLQNMEDTINAVKEITEDPERAAVFRRMRYEQEYRQLYGSD
jgi:hypothetical protein